MASEIRFLPSYVGSKRMWLNDLAHLKGRPFAELFAGSAVLSANLASHALVNDLDPVVADVLSHFDEQVVPEVFTRADYYRLRFSPEWKQHLYCLQSISFSGVFRYSKRGYNVPAKGGEDESKNKVNEFRIRPTYERALERWNSLHLDVRNGSYADVTDADIAALGPDAIVILDPPYEGSQAAYNGAFDYAAYWKRVAELHARFDVVIFDRQANIEAHGYPVTATRKMRVNGARPGDAEAMSYLVRD